MDDIFGSEGILIHNGNIILGMQKQHRWYIMDNNKKGAIVKTIGVSIEKEDKGSARKALKREKLEEISDILSENVIISKKKIFEKKISMGDLNPFDRKNTLKFNAKFYFSIIIGEKIKSNDLPYLLEIPIKEFLNLKFNSIIDFKMIEKYLIKSDKKIYEKPDYITLFIPHELIEYLEKNNEKCSFIR